MTTTLTSSIALLSAGLGLATMLSSTLPAASAGAVDVNIVAHPDDDIFFMNPDIFNAMLGGRTIVTVYLTGGNVMKDDFYYMHQREQGSRDTNAFMAAAADTLRRMGITPGATQNVAWDQIFTPIKPAFVHWTIRQVTYGQAQVTEADCVEYPNVHLIFLHFPATTSYSGSRIGVSLTDPSNITTSGASFMNLGDLYVNPTYTQASIDDSTVYNKGILTDALTSILDQWRPSVIRSQDWIANNDWLHPTVDPSEPGCLSKDSECASGYPKSKFDHFDHYWGAWFARDAVRSYAIKNKTTMPSYWRYRGYNSELNSMNSPSYLNADYVKIKKWTAYHYSVNDFHFNLDNQLCPFINGLYVLNQDSSDSTTRYQCQNGNGVYYGFNAFDVSQSSKYGYGAWYHQAPIQVTPADVLMAPASHW